VNLSYGMGPAYLNGFQIYLSHMLTEQKNIARSPSRARRRWHRGIRKVSPYADVPMRGIIRVGDRLFMHPVTFERMKRGVRI
jgi:hypothetical protein